MRFRKHSRSKHKNRKGATAVEFALVLPVFLLCLFACIDFSRFFVSISFVEITATKTVRHLSVLGATKAEAQDFAARELAIIGIDEFTIDITALENGSEQGEIQDTTTDVVAEVTVPLSQMTFLTRLFFDSDLIRTSATRTNRPQ